MESLNEQRIVNKSEYKIEDDALIKYGKLFERIKETNILPVENSEWSLESLEQEMNQVFLECGQTALDVNSGKIYTTLSGGLDSTLALAFLRKNFPTNEIVTFTMGGTSNHEDISHARLAAKKFATNHHEFIPIVDEIQKALDEYKLKFPESDLKKATETGDLDVYLLYKYISEFEPKVLLAYDGIDELMGGYWNHRKDIGLAERKNIYTNFWNKLVPDHLVPLLTTSDSFGIDLLFPYLDTRLIKTISNIPLSDRSSIEESKKPLRVMARELDVPKEILERRKRGQVGMLNLE